MKYIINNDPKGPLYITEKEVKLNYNCPASEKSGEGKGSCGGNNKYSDFSALTKRIDEIITKREAGHISIHKKLENMFGNKENFAITERLKNAKSVREKMTRKGIDDPAKFDDISGLRIITKDAKSTREAMSAIRKEYETKFKPDATDDYITTPKSTGYRAFHTTIMIDNEPHELQIRTENFNKWGETYHPIYKNEPGFEAANTESVRKYFKEMAEVYARLDEGEKIIDKPKCPPELHNLHACLE